MSALSVTGAFGLEAEPSDNTFVVATIAAPSAVGSSPALAVTRESPSERPAYRENVTVCGPELSAGTVQVSNGPVPGFEATGSGPGAPSISVDAGTYRKSSGTWAWSVTAWGPLPPSSTAIVAV